MEYKNSMGCRLQIRKIKEKLRFPSLFSKLVGVYISIVILMLIILFITFTQSFQAYFVQYTQNIMSNQAYNIAREYEKAGSYSTSKEEALASTMKYLQIMNDYLQATSWILDESGTGYIMSYTGGVTVVNEPILEEEAISEVFSGHVLGLQNCFKEYFNVPVLTVGYPMTMGDKVQYALFIHTPMPYVLQTIEDVRRMILNVVGLVGSIVFIWIYFVSKQMTRPLQEMNQVAKNIAGGHFNERITVKGKDEIAQLGLSLNHMAEELDRIEENRRTFIASVSHDLRSPLTSIQGFVTAILDGTIDANHQEKYLKVVLSETQRLITMTNAILDLNRMQEETKIIKEIFNINQMIESVVFSMENRSKSKHVHMYMDLDALHPHVYAQSETINRVIQNLLDNALKFVDEQGDILIRTRVQEQKLYISVFNSGPVIPKDKQQLIWERFYKCDASRGKDKNGVGLGLVIVKEILKQHEEEVGVRSEEGEMVEFYFSLTLAGAC